MRYLWDTPVLLEYLRNSESWKSLDNQYGFFNRENYSFASVVTAGEILSLSAQLNWGARRIQKMEEFLNVTAITPILRREILNAYAKIDAYSQGRLRQKMLPNGMSARNMGKNDLWIAATAHIYGNAIRLVTSDHDFDHLDGQFLHLLKF